MAYATLKCFLHLCKCSVDNLGRLRCGQGPPRLTIQYKENGKKDAEKTLKRKSGLLYTTLRVGQGKKMDSKVEVKY